MKATARRSNGDLDHEVEIRSFRFPLAPGATKEGTPTPIELLAASLAACSAEAIETYAQAKGWEIGDVVVEVECHMAERGSPARFGVVVRLPETLPGDQRRRLMSLVAKSPVHRTLEGETMFDERVELSLSEPAAAHGSPARRGPRPRRLLRRFSRASRRAA